MRHGLYRHGFMLCDRCVWNGVCEFFEAGGNCRPEREAFDELVGKLTEEYGLDGVADRILAERAAMYLVRLARGEAYEAWMGLSAESTAWGSYIARLDRSLRELLRELAVTRRERIRMGGRDALTVGLDELIDRFVRRAEKKEEVRVRRIGGPPHPVDVYRRVQRDWLKIEE